MNPAEKTGRSSPLGATVCRGGASFCALRVEGNTYRVADRSVVMVYANDKC
jgi:hypothetical protein